jgi:hypothetical protein
MTRFTPTSARLTLILHYTGGGSNLTSDTTGYIIAPSTCGPTLDSLPPYQRSPIF